MNPSLRQNPWLVYLLPFVTFMLIGSLEPSPPAAVNADGPQDNKALVEYRQNYITVYSAKIALTLAAMIFVWPSYREHPRLVHFLSLIVGTIGALIWIALAVWQHGWMPRLADATGIEWFRSLGQRSGLNWLDDQNGSSELVRRALFGLRMVGLCFVVPVIEEFFLRGFLMRYVMKDRWSEVPFGEVNRTAVIVGTAVPVLMHPQEAVAALVWFSLITWLMVRTRNIWDCVMAHAITNLLLGVYVAASDNWWLM